MGLCPHCGQEAGGRFCSHCNRPLPRFLPDEESRTLAYAGVDEEMQFDSGLSADAVASALRGMVAALAEGALSPDDFLARVERMYALVRGELDGMRRLLDDAAEFGKHRGADDQAFLNDYLEQGVPLAEEAARGFAEAFAALRTCAEEGDLEAAEPAIENARAAMDAMFAVDALTEKATERFPG